MTRQCVLGLELFCETWGLKFRLIPAHSNLDTEALQMAASVVENCISFFIVRLEHLIALKLKAWRFKDRLHINHLLDSGVSWARPKLISILQRHQLELRWEQLLAERSA